MTNDERAYKIAQLEEMLKVEKDPAPDIGGYGAHLSHWYGTAKPINIDAEAIECLIRHYKGRKVN